jgi:phosphoribosylaminoimidazole-succinocarboxamide synthase
MWQDSRVTTPEEILDAQDGLTHVHSGKVRDLYATDTGHLIMVASDRISAFDFILPNPIPDKGRILTAMTVWWFDQLKDIVDNHLIAVEDELIPDDWRGRAMLCKKLDMIPVEAVARGYLTGSGLLDYQATGSVCGVALPSGLVDGDKLPEPIFTPASKAPVGEHDENVSYETVAHQIGHKTAAQLKQLTLEIYAKAAGIAADRRIILADTKFEFGLHPCSGEMLLGDEVLTPDSSRFWPADSYRPGQAQPSYDKQYVRDWLTSPASGWDRKSEQPPPPLPDDVVAATRQRYIDAYETLTGSRFADWLAPNV